MVASKSNIPGRELPIAGLKIKNIQEFQYLGRVITQDGKHDTEIRRGIGKEKKKSIS